MHWDRETADEIAMLEHAVASMEAAKKWLKACAEYAKDMPVRERSGVVVMISGLERSIGELATLRTTLPQGRLYEELKRSKNIFGDITYAANRLEEICTETGNPTDARAHEKLVQVLRRLEEM